MKPGTGEFSAPLTELHDGWWNSIARTMGVIVFHESLLPDRRKLKTSHEANGDHHQTNRLRCQHCKGKFVPYLPSVILIHLRGRAPQPPETFNLFPASAKSLH